MPYKVPAPELTPVDHLYLEAGLIPGWRRVWSNGEDVTDDYPRWPDYVKVSYSIGWRPVLDLEGNFMP